MAWTAFSTALMAMFIGICYLDQPLSVQGYYAVCALFLTMSSFVLQKTVRDNNEDIDPQALQPGAESMNLQD
ncbi:YiaA/YiaB family inner membrane protein [Paenibacillus oenotherae]|nr:YiaA/YiaB family inner membrane protein [Paenibacillus oenotherae]